MSLLDYSRLTSSLITIFLFSLSTLFSLLSLSLSLSLYIYIYPRYHGVELGDGHLSYYKCGGQCSRRCARTQYKKPCLFSATSAAPSGLCPCYNNWKTKRGGPKCP
ncbi:unnamed protein product [Spirodela intermedia]|uniref:Uncharacterized protein n=1 Tax=Spirodela intermedia TaxID=51605 RepID=A0ABN7E9D6_SPIIN|nr:unnamed protein product [Spirodela intermedia]